MTMQAIADEFHEFVRRVAANDAALTAWKSPGITCHAPVHDLVALGAVLASNSVLTSLHLSDVFSGDAEDIAPLLGALGANSTLRSLVLDHNWLQCASATPLGAAIAANSTLRALSIVATRLGARAIGTLARALQRNRALTQLDLSENGMDAARAQALGRALAPHPALTQLGLRRMSSLSDACVARMARELGANTVLTALSLSGNPIGADGIVALLRDGPRALQRLALADVALSRTSEADAAALGAAVAGHSALAKLDLSRSGLGDAAALGLVAAIAARGATVRLRALLLRGNDLRPGTLASIADLLCEQRTLTRLDLEGSALDEAAAARFAHLLRANTTLRSLELTLGVLRTTLAASFSAQITQTLVGEAELVDALRRNTTLTHFPLQASVSRAHPLAQLVAANRDLAHARAAAWPALLACWTRAQRPGAEVAPLSLLPRELLPQLIASMSRDAVCLATHRCD